MAGLKTGAKGHWGGGEPSIVSGPSLCSVEGAHRFISIWGLSPKELFGNVLSLDFPLGHFALRLRKTIPAVSLQSPLCVADGESGHFFFPPRVIVLLRYNSHTVQSTHVKETALGNHYCIVCVNLPVLEISRNRSHRRVVFCGWLLSRGMMFSRFIHVRACVTTSFLFYETNIALWGCSTFRSSIRSLVDGNTGCFHVRPLWIRMPWAFVGKFAIQFCFSLKNRSPWKQPSITILARIEDT